MDWHHTLYGGYELLSQNQCFEEVGRFIYIYVVVKSSAAVYKGSPLFVKMVARVVCPDQLSQQLLHNALIHSGEKKRSDLLRLLD